MAQTLKEKGYLVIRTGFMDANQRKETRASLDEEMAKAPEFIEGAKEYVMGGFGAFAHPSSMHNPVVRRLRVQARKQVLMVMRETVKAQPDPEEWYFEQVIDRLMIRPQGKVPSAESWHRDEAKWVQPDDLVFGGWWNLDDDDQHFICVPGSHREVNKNTGFAKIPNTEYPRLEAAAVTVVVPPGAILVFRENIVHRVAARKAPHDMYRLFLSWRITKSQVPAIPNIDQQLEDQAVVTLKSGQTPPMYADLHWVNWRDKIVAFSEANIHKTIREVRVLEKRIAGGISKTPYNIVQRHLPSLRALAELDPGRYKLYQVYSPREVALYRPAKFQPVTSDN